MNISTDDQGAALTHVSLTKDFATREEIQETVLSTITVVELKGTDTALASVLEVCGISQADSSKPRAECL